MLSVLHLTVRCRNAYRWVAQGAMRFRCQTAGVAATEFAIISSVLILILLGLCDIVPAWMARNNVQTSAATAADVAGNFSLMQQSDMVGIYAAAAAVMLPFSAIGQSLRITNAFSDGAGNVKVYWSCGMGSLPPNTALTPYTTPTGVSSSSMMYTNKQFVGVWLDGTNMSYVVTEISYNYSAPAQFVLRSPLNLTGVSYYLPRNSSYIGFPWDGTATNQPTVPTSATTPSTLTLSNGATCSYAH